jgi:hypothetical protein
MIAAGIHQTIYRSIYQKLQVANEIITGNSQADKTKIMCIISNINLMLLF